MRKVTITITDEMLRDRCNELADEYQHQGIITFPSDEARAEFITDCVESALDYIELYDANPVTVYDSSEERLTDLASEYGYMNPNF